jgi:hypothetical protein
MKRAALRALDGLKNTTYLRRWLVLGGLIGVVAGVGAIVFIHALDLATELLLGGLGGYTPPGPVGEGHAAGSAGFDRPWAIPLVVGLGGLVSGLLTVRFAPEAEGHGTDAAIEAFHHNPGGVRPRAVLVKILASAVTIGAGGRPGGPHRPGLGRVRFPPRPGVAPEPLRRPDRGGRRYRLGHRRHLPGPAGRRGARR